MQQLDPAACASRGRWGGWDRRGGEEMLELNRIYNMDCMEGMRAIPNDSIDLIVTDPPYRTTSRGSAGNSGGMLQKKINKEGRVFKFNDISVSDYIPECYRVLKEKGHFYIMTNHVNLISMLNTCTENGFHFIKSLVWDKGNKIMGTAYMSQFEYILFFRKGGFKRINECGTADILSVPNKKTKGADGKNIHDTEKPVELMEVLIRNSSKDGDVVLDPFMGSGTTAVACINTNRNYIGFEIDPDYYEAAQERMRIHMQQQTIFELL